jgi:hypothetical protein
MTLVLKMLRDLSEHFDLNRTNRSPELEALMARTDVNDLAERLEEGLGQAGKKPDGDGSPAARPAPLAKRADLTGGPTPSRQL